MVGPPDDILAKLQEAVRRDLADFMTFEVGPDSDRPELQNGGMQRTRAPITRVTAADIVGRSD